MLFRSNSTLGDLSLTVHTHRPGGWQRSISPAPSIIFLLSGEGVGGTSNPRVRERQEDMEGGGEGGKGPSETGWSLCGHSRACTCACVCLCASARVYVCACVRARACTCVPVCVRVRIRVCARACTCMPVSVRTCATVT